MSRNIEIENQNHHVPAPRVKWESRKDKRTYWLAALIIYLHLVFPMAALFLPIPHTPEAFTIKTIVGSLIAFLIIFAGGLMKKSFREHIVARYLFGFLVLFMGITVLIYVVELIDSSYVLHRFE